MIQVKELTKIYRIPITTGLKRFIHQEYNEINAVTSVNFEINDGELIGILGANGAGKSTIIKMLSGILEPTNGTICIDGYIPSKREKHFLKEIGVMMGNRSSLKYDLPIRDSFRYLKAVYEIKDSEYDDILENLIKKIGLSELLDTPVRKLSLGQRMKAEIIASLIHHPKILFLDEPTLGLDVKSKMEVLEFIHSLQTDFHTTVLLTTHDLNDVERLCERIIYIDQGRIIYDGKTKYFGQTEQKRKVNITLYSDFIDKKILEDYQVVKNNDLDYTFYVYKNEVKDVLKRIEKEDVDEINIIKVSLEEAVLDYEKANR